MNKEKTPIEANKPELKPYCPRLMVRYNSSPINNYNPVWTCRMCLTTILEQSAVTPHIKRCMKEFKKKNLKSICTNNQYICDVCNKYFLKKVTLIKHIEQHKKEVNRSARFVVPQKPVKIIVENPKKLKICATTMLAENAGISEKKKCNVEVDEKTTESTNQCVKKITHICEVCNKIYSKKGNLNNHKKTHEQSSGKVPQKCMKIQ